MRIGCVGMASVDTALLSESRPSFGHESVTIVERVVVSAGGKGIVAAIAMDYEDQQVAPLALIGHDSRLPDMLPRSVGRGWLLRALEEDSRIWLSVSSTQHVVAWIALGHRRMDDTALVAAAEAYAASVDALYLAFDARQLLRAALSAAKRQAKPIAANISRPLIEALACEDRDLLRELVASAKLLLCNEDECARALRELGASGWNEVVGSSTEVVVTEGEAGGTFSVTPFDSWGRYEAVRPSRVRSVVGAGDTFNGAFLAARWGRGLSLEDSCQRAAVAAAECVATATSTLPLRE
jgi:sugar/nucleoside kinase (ribokinase family)